MAVKPFLLMAMSLASTLHDQTHLTTAFSLFTSPPPTQVHRRCSFVESLGSFWSKQGRSCSWANPCSTVPVAHLHSYSRPRKSVSSLVLQSTPNQDEKVANHDESLLEEMVTELQRNKENDPDKSISALALEVVKSNLSRMSATLVMKIRTYAATCNDESDSRFQLGQAMESIVNQSMEAGRETLRTFLQCGELRKLDAAIGKAAKEGGLDMAFFTVLSANLDDAFKEEKTNASDEKQEGTSTSRLQILRHIQTRCQEEMEKLISPGVALLHKLLRTEDANVRQNQLRHFLGPRVGGEDQSPKTITTPDGKVITLQQQKRPQSGSSEKEGTDDDAYAASTALVPPKQFVEAIAETIQKIKAVEETSGGAINSDASLAVVYSCRTVAKEARLALVDLYEGGEESSVVLEFQEALTPVFAPPRTAASAGATVGSSTEK